MKAELIQCAPLELAVLAAQICVGNDKKYAAMNDQDIAEYLGKIIARGHESVIEHVSYTFIISNISRALLQQISRHRHISLSVLSTRYTFEKEFDKDFYIRRAGVVLEDIKDAGGLLDAFIKYITEVGTHLKKCPNDTLKYFVPELIPTRIVLTVNARELRHLFRLRLASGAMKEFRDLMWQIYETLPERHRFIYKDIIDAYLVQRGSA